MPVSDLAKILAMGDPEAAGTATASNAMAPVVSPYLRDVFSGQYALQGLQGANDAFRNRDYEALAAMFGPGAIKAYHGSPYDFSAFDASKIGTGEGAQAYGHGLYFADNPNVARTYQSKVSAMQGVGGPTIEGRPIDWNNPTESAAFELMRHNGDRAAAADFWERTFKGSEVPAILRSNAALPEVNPPGKMYEVNINAEPDQFLNWDKPLSQQGESVKAAIGKIPAIQESLAQAPDMIDHLTGATVHELVRPRGQGMGQSPEIARQLREAGIPGIRYLDQGSRGAGQGTSNYVVFDPSIVDITKKYGLAALLAGAAGTGTDQ